MAETNYQMLEVLSLWLAEGLTSINKDNSANFLSEKKYNEEIRGGCLFFDNTQKNF